jgi:hypothetical protein
MVFLQGFYVLYLYRFRSQAQALLMKGKIAMKESSTRRNFLKTIGLIAASQIIPPRSLARKAVQKRLNILIIHTDEHRIDCLGAYGNTEIKTPYIDGLAADGVRYNNSFCPFPV